MVVENSRGPTGVRISEDGVRIFVRQPGYFITRADIFLRLLTFYHGS